MKTKSFILRIDADTMSAIEAWAADKKKETDDISNPTES